MLIATFLRHSVAISSIRVLLLLCTAVLLSAGPAWGQVPDGASSISAADIDGDSDNDILSAPANDEQNQLPRFRISPQFTDGASSVHAADLDGDGDNDILSASANDDKIAWYENFDGEIGSQQIISTSANDARSVYAADLDGDGDLDVLSASVDDDKIAWYENLNGTRDFSDEKIITLSAFGAVDVFAADIDGDGDQDVLSASTDDDTIAWYENGGAGAFSSEKIISNAANFANGVHAADIDGDGDLDVLSSSFSDDTIAWYENVNGDGSFSTARVIDASADGAINVFAADLDGDGDRDVISASFGDDIIAWYENTDGSGTFSAPNVISATADEAFEVYAEDLDGDGDPEVLSASFRNDSINIYDNQIGESGADADGFGPTIQVTTSADGADEVYAADLDGDMDADILSASRNDDTISYFENRVNEGGGFGSETVVMPSARADGAESVAAADLNGDGVLDILTSSYNDDKIAWYENDGTRWFAPQQLVDGAASGAAHATAGDIDGDGDIDVVAAHYDSDVIAWYANTDGEGTFSAANVLTTSADRAIHTAVSDIDGDGDLDILAASEGDDTVSWFENVDGAGSFSNENIIWNAANGASEVGAADFDGDGDTDVVATSRFDDTVAWFVNTDGAGSFSNEQVLVDTASDAFGVHVADLDDDGDPDILYAANDDDEVSWLENTDGAGTFSSPNLVTNLTNGPTSVFTADLNQDGKLDILTASFSDDEIAWYAQTESFGNIDFADQQIISAFANGAISVFAADLDADGDTDVLSASSRDDEISWYENTNTTPPDELEPEIAVSPDAIDFGTIDEGTSATEILTIENTGSAPLEGDVALTAETAGAFTLSSGAGAFELAPGGSQTVEVTFAPEEASSFEGAVAITHNGENEDTPVEVALSGEGEAVVPSIEVDAEVLAFGSVAVGATTAETVTIENTGNAPLEGEVNTTGTSADAFTISSGAGAFTLAPGETQEVEVTFAPEEASSFEGVVAISHNANNEPNPVEVALSGEGIAPAIAVVPADLEFGGVEVGTTATETVTVENTGSDALQGSVSLSGGADVFTLNAGSGDFTLAPGESREVDVTFAPSEITNFAGTVAISHNASNEPTPVEVSLTGEGLAPASPEIVVSPEAISFDAVVAGESATETLTIQNTGDAALEGSVSLNGDTDVFTLSSGAGAFDIASGETREVEITFAPEEASSYEGTVQISHNADNASTPVEVGLTGDGLAPAIAVDPSALSFGEITAGTSSTETFTIENTGSASLEGSVGLSDTPDAFSLTAGAGDFSIAPGGTQTVEVTFAPGEATSFEGTVAVSHNAGNLSSPVNVALSGAATPADPVVIQQLEDVELAAGAAASTWDLTQYVEPPATSSGPLTFSATSSNSFAADAVVEGSTLRVTPEAVGLATIEVNAETEAGGTATLSFVANVNALRTTVALSFGDPRSEASYRLVGLPGQVDQDVAATLSGEPETTWRVFRETGSTSGDSEDFLVAYDGSEAFRFAPGRGFWMLSRTDWDVDTTVDAIELADDSTTTVPIQEGWNILSNPLDQAVAWSTTLGLSANDGLTETLWQWDGSWSEAETLSTAREGVAYYLFNDGNLAELTLKHPAATETSAAPVVATTGDVEALSIAATLGDDTDRNAVDLGTLTIGRAQEARATRLPPAHFLPAQFYVSNTASDVDVSTEAASLSRLLKAETPGADSAEGVAFDLRLKTHAQWDGEPTAHVTLPAALTDEQFAGDEVLLVAPGGMRYDLRTIGPSDIIPVTLTDAPVELRVLIGSQAFIDEELQVPEEILFGPVYPNPSRGPVTIAVALPDAADAEIALYDMLGRRVATLHHGELQRGLNEVQWTGDNLASGMYFLRLQTGGRTFTEKVVRVR